MIERLSARATRLVSRLVVTTAPFLSEVPYACASRVATSEVMSTFASPETPRRPNSVRAPRLSQTIDEVTTAPASTVLNGYTFTPWVTTACSPTKHSSPSTAPSSIAAWLRTSQDRPTTEPRSRTDGPRYACSWTTERTTDASCFTTTSRPSTVYSPMCAPASMRQFAPMIDGPSTRASGSTSAPSPSHTFSRRRKPSISICTRPSRMSWCARRYASSVPTSSQ